MGEMQVLLSGPSDESRNIIQKKKTQVNLPSHGSSLRSSKGRSRVITPLHDAPVSSCGFWEVPN